MSSPGQVYLTEFTSPIGSPSFFYAGAENTTLDATIQIFPTDCIPGGARGTAAYTTGDGSAVAGEDYTATSGTTGEMCNDAHYEEGYCGPNPPPRQRTVAIPLTNDSDGTDAAVETFRFRLTGGQNAGLASPSSAPVHIIDADGSERFSFEPNLGGTAPVTYEKLERSREIRIPVFRAGSSTAATNVAITSQGSGDDPATEGVDYRVPGSLDFADGQRLRWLEIELVNDSFEEPDETFDVTLEDPGTGAIATTTVTILDDDTGGPGADEAPPGRLHHPKHRFRYPQNYPYLNEIHIFTSAVKGEEPPSTVFEAQLALRKRLKTGACAWWSGKGFRRGPCGERTWFDAKKPALTQDYFLYRLKQKLPKSVGESTKVRDYKIWGRWFDTVGRESRLGIGRNMNRFEVIAPSKECAKGSGTRFNFRLCKPKRP